MKFRFIVFLTLTLAGCTKEPMPTCEQEKICHTMELTDPMLVLLAGQSNVYNGSGLDCFLDRPLEGVYQFGRHDEFDHCILPAIEPLDHHVKVDEKIGFGQTFANLLYNHNGGSNDIVLVPCALSGTGFSDHRWNRSNDLYQDAVDRIEAVRLRLPNVQLAAILWHQGETDVNNGNLTFEDDLDIFIEDIRHDLGDTSVPFVLGGMVPYWVGLVGYRSAYQDILADTPERHINVGYADPSIPFVITKEDDTEDNIHFNAAGQREMGKRYFEQYLLLSE